MCFKRNCTFELCVTSMNFQSPADYAKQRKELPEDKAKKMAKKRASVFHACILTLNTDSHLVESVGVGYSWVVVGGDTAVCNLWRGSEECMGWVLDCSAGPCTGYWNLSEVPQTG